MRGASLTALIWLATALLVFVGGCGPVVRPKEPPKGASTSKTTTTTTTSSAPIVTAPAHGLPVIVTQLNASLVAAPLTAPAGEITFDVNNSGVEPSTFTIVKTEKGAGGLAVENEMAVVNGPGVELVAQVAPLGAGETKSVTLRLERGRYVLLSNTAGQYEAGVAGPFTVDGPKKQSGTAAVPAPRALRIRGGA